MVLIDFIKFLSCNISSTVNKSQQHQEKYSLECQESNPGSLGEKLECYLCAKQPPLRIELTSPRVFLSNTSGWSSSGAAHSRPRLAPTGWTSCSASSASSPPTSSPSASPSAGQRSPWGRLVKEISLVLSSPEAKVDNSPCWSLNKFGPQLYHLVLSCFVVFLSQQHWKSSRLLRTTLLVNIVDHLAFATKDRWHLGSN